jgi:hypothetical protein
LHETGVLGQSRATRKRDKDAPPALIPDRKSRLTRAANARHATADHGNTTGADATTSDVAPRRKDPGNAATR